MGNHVSDLKVSKVKTGIEGFDEVTFGGLPYGRPSLVSGYAGSGKTVFAIQFVLNGIQKYNEPGVFITLEETEEDLRKNMASFEYDLVGMENDGMLAIDNIQLRKISLYQSGKFDLTPLFLRIEEAINKVGAKRIAIDTFEQLFSEIKDREIFRRELMKLILWLKEKEITAIFTSEKPAESNPKAGVNEYITDCVINLSHSKLENVFTRRLHILKYRGSKHGTNEYPFLIGKKGISLLPITSREPHRVSDNVLPPGIAGLDEALGKKGFYAGSTTLVSGTSGTGKTSVTVASCIAIMKENKRALFFTLEESEVQLVRNMKSLGYDLEHYINKGLLRVVTSRPTSDGIESHLVTIYDNIQEFNPDLVVLDPVTDLIEVGTRKEVRGMLIRIIDYMRNNLISVMFCALVSSGKKKNSIQMSSMVDNWVNLYTNSGKNENLPFFTIVKTRGMDHARNSFRLHFSENGLAISESP